MSVQVNEKIKELKVLCFNVFSIGLNLDLNIHLNDLLFMEAKNVEYGGKIRRINELLLRPKFDDAFPVNCKFLKIF